MCTQSYQPNDISPKQAHPPPTNRCRTLYPKNTRERLADACHCLELQSYAFEIWNPCCVKHLTESHNLFVQRQDAITNATFVSTSGENAMLKLRLPECTFANTTPIPLMSPSPRLPATISQLRDTIPHYKNAVQIQEHRNPSVGAWSPRRILMPHHNTPPHQTS